MGNVAIHVRIFESDPSDDLVTKRTAAVKDLADQFGKERNVDALINISNGIVSACHKDGVMPDAIATLVEEAVRKQSSSFIREGNELQLLTVALLALDQQIINSKPSTNIVTTVEILAYTAWLALTSQPTRAEAKLEALRQEVLDNSRQLCLKGASQSRVRTTVADFKIESLAEDHSDLESKLKAAIEGPLNALRDNAVRDREEIDFLWWALSDYSSLMNEQLSCLSPPIAAIAAGLEAAQNLRRFPADSHKHILLRHVREHPSLTLQQLMDAIGDARFELAKGLQDPRIDKFPGVFTLLATIKSGKVTQGMESEWSIADWTSRALLEAGFLHIINLLPGAKV